MHVKNDFYFISESGDEIADLESEYESESETEYDTSPHHATDTRKQFNLKLVDVFRWLLIFLLTWQIAHCISDAAMNELLESIATTFAVTISSPTALGLSAFPVSLCLAYRYLKVDMDTFVKFVLCPKCLYLYDYNKLYKQIKMAR